MDGRVFVRWWWGRRVLDNCHSLTSCYEWGDEPWCEGIGLDTDMVGMWLTERVFQQHAWIAPHDNKLSAIFLGICSLSQLDDDTLLNSPVTVFFF